MKIGRLTAVARRLLWAALLLCGFAAAASAEQTAPAMRLVPQRIYEGISARIPDGFAPMGDGLFALKYGNRSRRTTVAYGDMSAEANIVFELKPGPVDLVLIKERIRQQLEKDPAIRRVSTEQTVISGKPAVVFEFESQAVDTTVFNIMFFLSVGPDRTLTGSFNCPAGMASQWQATGREIVHSISFD